MVEFLEAIALWGLRRWGEYFAFVATSAGIPYELYELAAKVTTLRLAAFLINVALLVYLVVSKRLLGVRGGKAAYDARLRSESIMQTAIDAAGSSADGTGATGSRRHRRRPDGSSGAPHRRWGGRAVPGGRRATRVTPAAAPSPAEAPAAASRASSPQR